MQQHRQTLQKYSKYVSRDNILERGLKLWKRQKTGSPVNPFKITFLGEPGVDTGALRKEFLSSEQFALSMHLVDVQMCKYIPTVSLF